MPTSVLLRNTRSRFKQQGAQAAVAYIPDPTEWILDGLSLTRKEQYALFLLMASACAYLWVLMPHPANAAFFVEGENWLLGLLPGLEEPIRFLINIIRAVILISFLSKMIGAYNAYNNADNWGQIVQEGLRLPVVLFFTDAMISVFIL